MRRRVFFGLLVLLVLDSAVLAQANNDEVRKKRCLEPTEFTRRPEWHPPELQGSKELVVAKQNKIANRLNLPIVWTDDIFDNLKNGHNPKLVPIFNNRTRLYIGFGFSRQSLPFAYATPQTVAYLDGLAKDFYDEFKAKLRVTSGVRTLALHKLITYRMGKNAVAFDYNCPETWSLHLRGLAIDISRTKVVTLRGRIKSMTKQQKNWMRARLIKDYYDSQQRVQPTEETVAYHIVVFDASFLTLYHDPATK